jgi:hypothetical protein
MSKMVKSMSNIPVFSKQMLVEDVVNHNRNNDFCSNIFLRGNGDFFKSDGEKTIASHLKSVQMEHLAHKFELRYFNDYSVNNKTHKGFVLGLKDPTAEDSNQLMDNYLQARKQYVDSRVTKSHDFRLKTLDDTRIAHPNAFIGLPGKEFFSDPLTISKIGRNELLKDKIDSRPISNTIKSYQHANDGTDSVLESTVSVYEVFPKPNSGLTQDAMISAIHSIYNIVEQNKDAQNDFDQTVQEQAFTDDVDFNGYNQDDLDYMSRADNQDFDIGQNAPQSFAQETGFDSNDYGDPVNNNGESSPVQNLQGNNKQGDQQNSKKNDNPQFKQNAPKFKDPTLNNLIDNLVDKEDVRKDRDDSDNTKDSKGKKNSVDNEASSARIANLIAETLAKIMELVLLVLKALFAILKALVSRQSLVTAVKDVYEDFQNKPQGKGGSGDLENKKSLENSLDKNGIDNTIANSFAGGLTSKGPKAIENPSLDAVGNNSPPRATDLDVPFGEKRTASFIQLDPEKLDQLKSLKFSPEEIKQLTENIEVPKEHKIAKGLADVPPEFGYSQEHGASLSVTDTVKNPEGTEGTVLGGFDKNGEMFYSVASKDANGNYEISSYPASELTAIGYGNSELKDNPELIDQLYKEQLASAVAEDPNVKDFKIPSPWSETHFPWERTEKATISTLAEHGIPVVKGIQDIDLSNVKPFDEVKAEVAENAKDKIFIAAMHTNKTSSIRDQVNVHPLFGELLNVNDKVSLNLPTSDRLETGAVVGAYVNNEGDLKYQIKLADGLITNVNAQNVAVVEYDQGGLSKGELKTYAGGLPTPSKLDANDKVNNGQTIHLYHEGTDSYTKDYSAKTRAAIASEFPNLISGQLALDSNNQPQDVGRVISRINKNNKQEKFVTVGRFIKNENGVERDVYMAMPVSSNALTPNTARNKHLLKDSPEFFAVDDPNVKIEANGITSASLKELVGKVSGFIHNNIDKGKEDYIHKKAVMEHTSQESLMNQIHIDRDIEKQELNVKSALAYQALLESEPELTQGLNSNIAEMVDVTNQIQDQYQNTITDASPLTSEATNQILLGSTVYPKEVEKTGELYQGVDHADLTLVRVQNGVDGIQSNGRNLILNHDMNNSDSVRNTMHFALNGHVNNHAYGEFDSANFALITNLKQTAQENQISGLSASDTWFHSNQNKFVLPNATLIAPEDAVLPDTLNNENINIVRFKLGENPEETLSNRNLAISEELKARNVPEFQVGMHNWNGHRLSEMDQVKLSNSLGFSDPLPNNHSTSVDGQLESHFARLLVLKETLAKGELEFLNSNNAQWYRTEDTIKSTLQDIKTLVDEMPDSQGKAFFVEKIENQLADNANAQAQIQDFSEMTIPDNSALISNSADDLQEPFVQTSDIDLNQTNTFDGPPLSSYEADVNREPVDENLHHEDNFIPDDSHVPTPVELIVNNNFIPNMPPIPGSMENQNTDVSSQYNALGFIAKPNPVENLSLVESGYPDLDQHLDDLRAMATNEPNDTPIVYVINEVREELLGLQNDTLKAGETLFAHPNIKDEVEKISSLSSVSDGTLISFAESESGVQLTYPNIAQIQHLSSIGNVSPETQEAVGQLIDKLANDPEIKPLLQNYLDSSETLGNYVSAYTVEMSKFVSKTLEHEGFQSGYFKDEQLNFAVSCIDQLKDEATLLLDAVRTSQTNASYIGNSVQDADKGMQNLVDARITSNVTSELKATFVNELTASQESVVNHQDKTIKQDNSHQNTI